MESGDLSSRIEREKRFHDRWAGGVDPQDLDPRKVARCPTTPETACALKALGALEGRRLLEIGCGTGELTSWLALEGAEVTARDVSPRMIEVARRLARRSGVEASIRFEAGPGEMLPHEDGTFDLVFGHDVLHHMDLGRAMGEIRRVLRAGGRAVFAEPLGHNPVLNRYRAASPETRTADERPLLFGDFDRLRAGFSSMSHREFHLLTMAIFLWFRWVERLDPNRVRYWKRIIDEAERYRSAFRLLDAADRALFAVFPPARRWARMTVIVLDR
ncbi:MAG TPA: class I SAM-dependent methyltransferase [Candidatus Saccharimonadales bacterium]|nr:class I SAM-dependent methyltransferase [Candidatus Saccharimonadales bacterium]